MVQITCTSATGNLLYLHADHLGSTVLETYSCCATVHESQQYYAYGAKRGGGTLQTDQLFTGQKQDSTGLMYYRSRYYDPSLGQFISPDTLVPDATSVLSYNRFMYTRGNPLNRNDPTGHNDAIFDQYGGGGGKEAILIKAAIDLVAITIATQRATHGPPPLVAPRVPSWDEFWPQQQEEQPSVTGFPTITTEDDGLHSTPSSPGPGMDVLAEPGAQQQEVGSNVVSISAGEVIQTLTQDATQGLF